MVKQGECCVHLRRASLGDSATLDRGVGRLGGKKGREKGKDSEGRDREGEREGVEGGRVGKLWTAGQIRLTIGFCKEHFLGAQLF